MLTPKILPAILIVVPAAILLTAQASLSEPTAEECRTRPGSSTPRGGHWYYRINRTDKQRCWYLSSEGMEVRSHGRGTTSLVSSPTPTPEQASAAETERAAPAQATPARTASAPMAAAQAAPAEGAVVEPSIREHGMATDFAARWPDLPKSQDLDGPELAAISNSYADRDAATDAGAQMPLTWPVIEDHTAQQASAGEAVLRSISLAGALMTALLLLAAWVLKLAHRRHLSRIRSTAEPRHGDLTARTPTPTDPAHDLKTSLAELMRDLQRAGAGNELASIICAAC